MNQPTPAPTATMICAALAGDDLESTTTLFDDASLLHLPGRSGFAGQYQGREAIVAVLRRMAELTGGTLRMDPSRVIAADGRTQVVTGNVTAARGERQLHSKALHVASLRDGTVRELWVFHSDQSRVDDFWTAIK